MVEVACDFASSRKRKAEMAAAAEAGKMKHIN